MCGMNETVNLTLHIYACVLVIHTFVIFWSLLAVAIKNERINKKHEMCVFNDASRNTPNSITEFDTELWTTLVEKVAVSHDRKCGLLQEW